MKESEAIINAFCHHDYRDPDYVQVAIFKDRVEIRNPGELYGGLTIDRIRKGNVSRRRNPLIAELLRRIQMVGLAIAFASAALLLIFPQEIGDIFLKESAEKGRVLNFVQDYYRWMALILPCFAVVFAIQGVLRSAGDTMALLALSFLSMFVIRIPLAYLLAGPLGFRQDGIWMAIFFSGVMAVGLNWLYYARGPWKKKGILGTPKITE